MIIIIKIIIKITTTIIIIIVHYRAPFLKKKLRALYNTFSRQSQILHNSHSRSHSSYKELSLIKNNYHQIFVNDGITGIEGWCINSCGFLIMKVQIESSILISNCILEEVN